MAGWVGFGDQDPLITSADSGWDVKIALTLASLVGAGLTLGFLYRLLKNPPCFLLYEDGFEYIPAGVSTGLIKFSDVVELRDETVLVNQVSTTGRNGVTAVVLRNPEEYVRRFPAAMQPLLRARGKMNSSAILITHGEFGSEHDRILAMVRERVAKAAGRGGDL